jgi:hypothetical protein
MLTVVFFALLVSLTESEKNILACVNINAQNDNVMSNQQHRKYFFSENYFQMISHDEKITQHSFESA